MIETPTPAETPGSEPTVYVRVCRFCSAQVETSGAFCPACGKSYMRERVPKRTKVVVGLVVTLLLLGGGSGLLIKKHRDDLTAQRAAAAASKAKAAAAQEKANAEKAEADAAAAQEAKDDAERAQRKAAVKEMQKSITKDAKDKVSDGILDGPILYSSCDPLGGGSTDDLTAITTTFSCLAVNKENNDGTVSGYSFSATMNWTQGSYSWRLGS